MSSMISREELKEIEISLINTKNKHPNKLLMITIVVGLFSYYIISKLNQYL